MVSFRVIFELEDFFIFIFIAFVWLIWLISAIDIDWIKMWIVKLLMNLRALLYINLKKKNENK